MRSFFLLLLCALALPVHARVVASIEPLAMAARGLLGADADVAVLLRPSQSIHQVSLTPGQLASLNSADLFLWLGADAEPQLAPLVRRRKGPSLALLEQPGVFRLDRGTESVPAHGHFNLDPHLWLYPDNIRLLAKAVAAERHLPASQLQAFNDRLTATVKAVREQLGPVAGRPWLSGHNPWAYFARTFGLREPLTLNPNPEAGASSRRVVALARTMQEQKVTCAIAEPEAPRALVNRLCRGDCRVVAVDPVGRDVTTGNYAQFLRSLGNRFAGCLGK